MDDLIQESRRAEQAKIAANWLRRIRECISGTDTVKILDDAMRAAAIAPSDVVERKNIEQRQLDDVIYTVVQHVPDISLRMFARAELSDLGVMGYAAICSDTIGRALKLLFRYHELTSDRYVDSMAIEDDRVIVFPVPLMAHIQNFRNIAEDSLAGNWRTLTLLLGPDVDFSIAEVHFDFPPPSYVDTFHDVFDCAVYFNAERNELRFPARWLDFPVASANRTMADVCTAMCERLLGPMDTSRATPQRVRRLLLSRPGRKMYRLEEAATELNLSKAQLRKRLYRAGTSYKRLVLEMRMALAEHYLRDTALTIQEIAYLLDYSQPAPFSRAFKAYFGQPPVNRREIRA